MGPFSLFDENGRYYRWLLLILFDVIVALIENVRCDRCLLE
jgi:hypothetical protein